MSSYAWRGVRHPLWDYRKILVTGYSAVEIGVLH
jgi:hypothetical protein